MTEIDKKKSLQEGSHQQKKDSSVRAAPEQVDQDNMLYLEKKSRSQFIQNAGRVYLEFS